MLRLEGTSEKPQKSIAMKYLSTRNNVADSILRRHLGTIERQKSVNIYNIDKDRLDLRDILKEIKYCESEFHPTAQIYLGRDISKRSVMLRARLGKNKRLREVQTAPPVSHQLERLPQINPTSQILINEPMDAATALQIPAPDEGRVSRSVYLQTTGGQRRPSFAPSGHLTEKSYGGSTSLNSIAKKQRSCANPGLPCRSLINMARNTRDLLAPINMRQHHLSCVFQRANTISSLRDMETSHDINDVFERKDHIIIEERGNIERGASTSDSESDGASEESDTPLATTKVRSKREPISTRLKSFYSKINKITERNIEVPPEILKKKLRRNWILITKGIDAALAESSDEEET